MVSQITDYLQGFLQKKVDEMRQKLTDSRAVATDNLRAGIAFRVLIYPNHIEGVISVPTDEEGNNYSQYVDLGVDGTKRKFGSPFKFRNERVSVGMERKLAFWIKAKYGAGKGFVKRGDYYGLGVQIKRRGIRPTRFFSDVITESTTREFGDSLLKTFKINVSDNTKKP